MAVVRSALIQTFGSMSMEENVEHQIELIHQAAERGAQITCLQELATGPIDEADVRESEAERPEPQRHDVVPPVDPVDGLEQVVHQRAALADRTLIEIVAFEEALAERGGVGFVDVRIRLVSDERPVNERERRHRSEQHERRPAAMLRRARVLGHVQDFYYSACSFRSAFSTASAIRRCAAREGCGSPTM